MINNNNISSQQNHLTNHHGAKSAYI